jgi:bifunctional non-homologous end joining protein LigD
MKEVSLYYREGSSDKEYHVRIEPKDSRYIVTVAYGRRGSTLSTGTKTNSPVDLEEATKVFMRLVTEKKAKGYTEGETGAPYQHSEKVASGVQCQLLNPVDEEDAARLMADMGWCMQEKKDGRRMLLQKKDTVINGINRKGLIVGVASTVLEEAQQYPNDFIIDGEAVGDMLYAFDLLEINGYCIRSLPYEHRLDQLYDLLELFPLDYIKVVETAMDSKEKLGLLNRLKQQKAEGVVFKQLSAPYTPGRPNSGGTQLKHKFYATASAVVSKVNQQRSVELKLWSDTRWVPVGNVTIPPNFTIPAAGDVLEIRYLYAFPESKCLYQPVYLGTRSDVSQTECHLGQLKYKAEGGDEEG